MTLTNNSDFSTSVYHLREIKSMLSTLEYLNYPGFLSLALSSPSPCIIQRAPSQSDCTCTQTSGRLFRGSNHPTRRLLYPRINVKGVARKKQNTRGIHRGKRQLIYCAKQLNESFTCHFYSGTLIEYF